MKFYPDAFPLKCFIVLINAKALSTTDSLNSKSSLFKSS
nr:MAG TPA: hypothetical protein [Caudoviricetes sp.]